MATTGQVIPTKKRLFRPQLKFRHNYRKLRLYGINTPEKSQANGRAGYAWQYRKYCKASFCGEWLSLEEDTRNAQIGLWQEKNAIAPWKV